MLVVITGQPDMVQVTRDEYNALFLGAHGMWTPSVVGAMQIEMSKLIDWEATDLANELAGEKRYG